METSRDEMIRIICEIWSKLLATDVQPEDDFFDLGGYSLLTVNFVVDARQRGLEVPAGILNGNATPATIADALLAEASRNTAAQGSKDPDFSSVWETALSPLETEPARTLVPFVTEGEGTPVFCFHWGGGIVRFMRDLADSFRSGRPVYGLEAAGKWTRERPALSVVEMASRYLSEIREVQPQGPYLFVGPCAGGRIAYEAARQLEQAGEKVAVLAVVNGMAPGVSDLDPSWGLRELYDFRLASLRAKYEVPDLTTVLERLMADEVEIAHLDEGVDPADFFWSQAVWAAGAFAQDHYEPRLYGGEVTLFQLAKHADLPSSDWSRMAASTETYTFEGTSTLHLLRQSACAELLAKKLAAYQG